MDRHVVGLARLEARDNEEGALRRSDVALYAAKRAGRNLSRESLMAAFESFKGYDTGILPPITIGPDHETQKQGFWVRVEKGRFKQITDWLKSE